jgi:hypothetical protein
MNIRRLQGAALIISAVIGLVGLIGSGTAAVRALFILGGLLLIFGVPAIELVQQAGMLDWVGIALIELAAIIALVLNIGSVSGASITSSAIPLLSAILGGVGRVIVGWLTIQRGAFMKWVGWAFVAEGILNLVGGLIGSSALASAVGILVVLLGAAALLGYGWGIMQHSGSRASA